MMIKRHYNDLNPYLKKGKALVIYGSRQTGKTTLLKQYLDTCPYKYRLESGDDITVREILQSEEKRRILEYVEGYDLLAIDEAQKIKGVGKGLKIITDQAPDKLIVATGSSSFELAGQVGEPLTGRKKTLILYPIAQLEMAAMHTPAEQKTSLEEFLIYGGYPEVVTAPTKEEKKETLNELARAYLLKDILELERIKSARLLLDMLRLLAFQLGNEVSLHEIGTRLGIDGKTVARYLDLFEKSFILFNVRGYSRNLRNEITKKSKYYFFDNGIRNAIISNFNELALRNDTGQLWENFLVTERLKKQAYTGLSANNYFWRTWEQREVDWLEEREGALFAYEFKWSGKKTGKGLQALQAHYPETTGSVIDRDNYLDFILG